MPTTLLPVSKVCEKAASLEAGDDPCRLFFEYSPVGFCVLGGDFRFLKVNRSFCKLLGYPEAELLDLSFPDIIHPGEDKEKGMYLFSQLMRAEIPGFEMEKRFIRENGAIVWVELTVALIHGKLGEPGAMVISRDILSEKLAEEQRKAHGRVQRNTLIREVNHRIKNNIQSTIGLLRYQTRQNPELGKAMQMAIDRLQAVAIVHGTQGISRLGNCSLVRMVSQICDCAQTSCSTKQTLKLQVLVPNEVIVEEGESVPIALIVNELIANAMKHGNIRKSPIRVTLDGDRNTTTIRIENAASGRDVFRMESGNGLGTGLGLVRALLPPAGAILSFKPGHGEVTAELLLSPPVIG